MILSAHATKVYKNDQLIDRYAFNSGDAFKAKHHSARQVWAKITHGQIEAQGEISSNLYRD